MRPLCPTSVFEPKLILLETLHSKSVENDTVNVYLYCTESGRKYRMFYFMLMLFHVIELLVGSPSRDSQP